MNLFIRFLLYINLNQDNTRFQRVKKNKSTEGTNIKQIWLLPKKTKQNISIADNKKLIAL